MIRLFFIFAMFFFCNGVFADQEIQRIDSIVQDITKLRQSYEKQLSDAKEKNIILEYENKEYKKKIAALENQIKNFKKSTKTKEKPSKMKKIVVIEKVCKDENPFPKLQLKKEFVPKKKFQKSSLMKFHPSAFRLRNDASIYADMSSKKIIAKWEKGTSFTSNIRTQERIKITGYFVKRVWRKADKEMWIESSDVMQRVIKQ